MAGLPIRVEATAPISAGRDLDDESDDPAAKTQGAAMGGALGFRRRRR
jgi:hypothetical protein